MVSRFIAFQFAVSKSQGKNRLYIIIIKHLFNKQHKIIYISEYLLNIWFKQPVLLTEV